MRDDVFGWHTGNPAKPVHDPGMKGKCPYCAKKLSGDFVTISVPGTEFTYFYRMHKKCRNFCSEAEMEEFAQSCLRAEMVPT